MNKAKASVNLLSGGMGSPAAVRSIDQFAADFDPRMPKADLSNAPYLFGDPSSAGLDTYSTLIGSPYGDVNSIGLEQVGDSDDFGDAAYGDASYGAPLPNWAKIAGAGVLGAGAGYLTSSLIHRQKMRQMQSQLIQQQLAAAAGRNTITNSVLARRMMGRIPLNTPFQFYSVMGANLNQYPLAPTEYFAADSLKYNLDQQAAQTPYEVEIANGVISGANLVATANGLVANRFFPAIICTIGINALAANPGTVMTVTASIPTVAGTLTISAQPFSFTFGKDYYAKLIIYPWSLVTNKPLLVQGQYSNAAPIVVTVSGIPTSSSVNLIVPGSMHQWTIAMRNRLVQH